MEDERNLHAMATPTYELAPPSHSVVFCSTVNQAERFTEILNRHEPECARCVSAKTPKDQRRKLFRDFTEGAFRFLVNCAICTEGWDEPRVRMVACCSPTKSWSRYVQVVGRGLRPLPGIADAPGDAGSRRDAIAASDKPECLILDFVGNSGRHKLVSMVDILGGTWPEPVRDRAAQILEEGRLECVEDALEAAADELEAEREAEEKRELARRARLKAKAEYTTREYNPFDVLDIDAPRTTAAPAASTKSIEFLMKFGIDATGMSQPQASKLQREVFRRLNHKPPLCSIKQARILKQHGHSINTPKAEATKILDRIFGRRS
jgi:superfamily II DNA or RNA helicase